MFTGWAAHPRGQRLWVGTGNQLLKDTALVFRTDGRTARAPGAPCVLRCLR